MKIYINVVLVLLSSCLLLGCQTPGEVAPVVDPDGEDYSATTHAGGNNTALNGQMIDSRNSASTSGVGQNRTIIADPYNPASPLASNQTIYFDFDSSAIRADMQDVLAQHASYMANHPEMLVTLSGHADERGTREYNIALGERRSNAVKQVLVLHSAYSQKLETVSYGEEKPLQTGHDEASWAKNRRVEIVYPER